MGGELIKHTGNWSGDGVWNNAPELGLVRVGCYAQPIDDCGKLTSMLELVLRSVLTLLSRRQDSQTAQRSTVLLKWQSKQWQRATAGY